MSNVPASGRFLLIALASGQPCFELVIAQVILHPEDKDVHPPSRRRHKELLFIGFMLNSRNSVGKGLFGAKSSELAFREVPEGDSRCFTRSPSAGSPRAKSCRQSRRRVQEVCSIGYQTSRFDVFSTAVHHRYPGGHRQGVGARRSKTYEQDATRHAALGCLLRVTADDIRQRYSAPVSGILAPQVASNLRIVTKL